MSSANSNSDGFHRGVNIKIGKLFRDVSVKSDGPSVHSDGLPRDMHNAIEAPTCMDGETLRAVIAQSFFCQQVLVRPDLRQRLRGVGCPLH
jgi:hypothetical protein